MRWFVRSDIDGFFGLALDNFVQLLLIDSLCRFVLGFPDELLYGRILPGVALSLVVGNLFYAWQARRLARQEGRTDVCALPYGINTPSLLAYVFLVMLPVKLVAEQNGHANPAELAWQAGLLACLGSGFIEFLGSFVAERIRRATPRAALLSTLAGIALGFISLGFVLQTFAHPIVGLSTLAVVALVYFGRVQFKGGIPGGLVAVVLGTTLAWCTGIAPTSDQSPASPTLWLPAPALDAIQSAFSADLLVPYLSVIIPMGLFNLVGSLQNIESAEAAGDSYAAGPSLLVNGTGTLTAAVFGSCFPTTLYIGHPGWKAMGARAGYSIYNAAFIAALCLSGTLSALTWAIPVDAGMAIVLWIGLVIVAQSFQATPRHHAPAVVMGLLPGLAAWGAMLAKGGLKAAGMGTPERPFDGSSEQIVRLFQNNGVFAEGLFALEQGFLFTSMILAAATVSVIERRFHVAAIWCGLASVLSATGILHSFQWSMSDTVLHLTPAWPWTIGYASMGVLFLAARWITREEPPLAPEP